MTSPNRRLFTAANAITIGRLLLLIPLFMFLREGREENGNFWAMVIMGTALVTDMLDGLVARAFNQVSDWGKVLDPLTDKLWTGCLALFLALPWREHPMPWPFVLLLLSRDLAIVGAGVYAYRRMGILLMSNWLGKITMAVEIITLIAYTIFWTPPWIPFISPVILMYLSTVLILLSSTFYMLRLKAMINAAPPHSQPQKVSLPKNSSIL